MPVFKVDKGKAKQLKKDFFSKERGLQSFCETNLENIFGVRFIKTEHITGDRHKGRIDSLGIDEDGNPVIFEYKKREDENIITQGLFYLAWLKDHKGDFQVLVQDTIKDKIEISWDKPRVILVAQSYSKYDRHAQNELPENLEFWTYSLYEEGIFVIEKMGDLEIEKKVKTKEVTSREESTEYNFQFHINKTTKELSEIFYRVRDRILELEGVEERSEQKTGISYRTTMSFVRFEFHKNQINMMVKSPKYNDPKKLVRDVTTHGWGYKGQVKIEDGMDSQDLFLLVKQSYEETL